jgi:hypothetical protein
MDTEDIRKLSASVDKKVRIVTTEGETFVAKVLWVDEEHHDLVYDLISTTTPERYKQLGVRSESACLIPFDYISRIDMEEDASMKSLG